MLFWGPCLARVAASIACRFRRCTDVGVDAELTAPSSLSPRSLGHGPVRGSLDPICRSTVGTAPVTLLYSYVCLPSRSISYTSYCTVLGSCIAV